MDFKNDLRQREYELVREESNLLKLGYIKTKSLDLECNAAETEASAFEQEKREAERENRSFLRHFYDFF